MATASCRSRRSCSTRAHARGERTLILRHDVDQHPASALVAARIERRLDLQSTWYMRWRTADPAVIDALRAAGGSVGFHYETLTRRVLGGGFDRRAGLDPLLDGRSRGVARGDRRLQGPVRPAAQRLRARRHAGGVGEQPLAARGPGRRRLRRARGRESRDPPPLARGLADRSKRLPRAAGATGTTRWTCCGEASPRSNA